MDRNLDILEQTSHLQIYREKRFRVNIGDPVVSTETHVN